MRLSLHGGFGEKGRTCIGLESGGMRLLLDAGIKTSARDTPDYYPALSPEELAATDAIIITHGHEDHVAALGWCLAHGFAGDVYITPEARRDTYLSLADYATAHEAQLARQARFETLPVDGAGLRLGPLTITTGRSGHIGGGVWCQLVDRNVRFTYCGDVVAESPVFAMDPLPASDVVALDASYGDDDVSPGERAQQIATWVRAHAQGCVLPTPLYGRSAELLAIVPGALALAPGMRAALEDQIRGVAWLTPGMAGQLAQRLATAGDWSLDAPLPRAALLCHDGMGLSGPARVALEGARDDAHPVLFTGHVPEGSPGAHLLAQQRADWIRLPTHPRLSENVAIARATGASLLIGHSCELPTLQRLGRHLPALRSDVVTGDVLEV
ncbi:MAG TPA: MBL fold metallo-hydrolase [Burkholderiales bacterium]|nr:MBL fold metallo-hydrolase [Burkholderiales bacterium]